jgi:hypothetical protein
VQIENPDLHPIVVVIANRKPMFYKLSFHWKKLRDVMVHHFQIEIQIKLKMEKGQNLMFVPQNTTE